MNFSYFSLLLFQQNGLEMLVSELCVNLIDAVNKCEYYLMNVSLPNQF